MLTSDIINALAEMKDEQVHEVAVAAISRLRERSDWIAESIASMQEAKEHCSALIADALEKARDAGANDDEPVVLEDDSKPRRKR